MFGKDRVIEVVGGPLDGRTIRIKNDQSRVVLEDHDGNTVTMKPIVRRGRWIVEWPK